MTLLYRTALFIVASLAFAGTAQAATPSELVNVFVGTGEDHGNTFPGASMPHGMTQLSPVTVPTVKGGGYVYGDSAISGFALTRLSGIPCPNLGDAPIMPLADPVDQPVAFSHADEQAGPGYYRVRLGSGVTAEMTATARTGTFRFTFPNGHGYVRVSALEGESAGPGICGGPARATVHYIYAFDQPFTVENGLLAFNSRTVVARAAVSYTDAGGARRNLQAENPVPAFDPTRAQARAAWNAKLNLIRVNGGRDVDRRKFYTALYHSLLAPNLFNDVGRPTRYTNISGWDAYRTQFPLLCLIAPAVARDVVLSLLAAYDRTGQLGKWEYGGVEQGIMVGDSADVMIATAVAFKVPGIPIARALAAMVKGATVPQQGPFGYPSRNAAGYVQRPGLTEYLQYGYLPDDHDQGFIWGSASTSLEYMIDDFAISRVAATLGQRKLAARFLKRSRNWRKLVNPATGFIEPRHRDGSFIAGAPLDQEWVHGYTEGTGWQYTWMVPHDLAGLIAASGGKRVVSERLDRFFGQVTGGTGGGYTPFMEMGNEPSFATPWTYLATGEPRKAQRVIRRVQNVFTLAPNGLPGDDDLGATSAWFVWSAIGRYPVNPASGELARTAPLFSSVVFY